MRRSRIDLYIDPITYRTNITNLKHTSEIPKGQNNNLNTNTSKWTINLFINTSNEIDFKERGLNSITTWFQKNKTNKMIQKSNYE